MKWHQRITRLFGLNTGPCRQTEITIRQMRDTDIPALARLENKSFDQDIFSEFLMEDEDFLHFLENTDGDTVFVAENEKGLIGYIALEFYPEDNGPLKKSADIYSIAIDPDRAGSGIGNYSIAKRLLQAAEALVAGHPDHDSVHFETHQANSKLVNILTRYGGYRQIGRIEDYYGDGGGAIQLCKYLGPDGPDPSDKPALPPELSR